MIRLPVAHTHTHTVSTEPDVNEPRREEDEKEEERRGKKNKKKNVIIEKQHLPMCREKEQKGEKRKSVVLTGHCADDDANHRAARNGE